MSTQAQIEANRRNAQKSTGPRTAAGKAVVSQNAVKHGLFASENVIYCENQIEFDCFREELVAEMAPIGTIESILAERIARLSWRLRRAARMHNEAIDVLLAKVETSRWQNSKRGPVKRGIREPAVWNCCSVGRSWTIFQMRGCLSG